MAVESEGFALITPLSLEIEKGGKTVNFRVEGTSKEVAREAAKAYADLIGGTFTQILDEQESSSFGFDSRKWNGCNWEPKGPQNNPDLN